MRTALCPISLRRKVRRYFFRLTPRVVFVLDRAVAARVLVLRFVIFGIVIASRCHRRKRRANED